AARRLGRADQSGLQEPTPGHCHLPGDRRGGRVSDPPREHGSVFTSVGWNRPHMIPDEKLLRQAADVLNAGEKVAILIGQGARDAAAQVIEVADLLGSGVAKALLGKDVLPDTLPFVTGGIGLLGTEPSNKMVMGCDTLL